MTTLADINPDTPTIKTDPQLFPQLFRALAAAVIGSFEIEHQLTGEHKILVGPVSERPAPGNEGRFYVQTLVGNPADLMYDTGAAWVNLTNNVQYGGYAPSLAAHRDAVPIDHEAISVTAAKIALGAILKRHLDGSNDATPIGALVDGSDADAFHSHPQYSLPEFTPYNLSDVAAGWVMIGNSRDSLNVPELNYTLKKRIKIKRSGVINTAFTLYHYPDGIIYGKIYVNNIPQGVEHVYTGTGGLPQAFEDEGILVTADDEVQVYCKNILDPFSNPGSVSAFELYGDWECETLA